MSTLLIAILGCAAALYVGYQIGRLRAYDTGYSDGYEAGNENARQDAYDTGYAAGRNDEYIACEKERRAKERARHGTDGKYVGRAR